MGNRCLAAMAAVALSACGGGSSADGSFTLDPSAVRLAMVQGQAAIPSRDVLVQVTGRDAAYVGAGYTSGQQPSWLSLDLVQVGSGAFQLRISLSTNTLEPGEYATTFQVGTADANGAILATKDVQVTAAVVALDVAPAELVLGGADGLTPGAQALSLILRTGTAVAHPYALTLEPAQGGWLTASALSGVVGDAGQVISLDADTTGLAPGTYPGQVGVTVTFEDLQITRTIPVTLNLEEHRLVLGEGGVGFTSSPGRSVLQRDVGVFSSLGRSVAWSASADQAWLTVTPAGLTGGSLHLAADPTGLAAGQTYFAEVTVRPDAPDVANTQQIRVGLAVRSAAAPDVSVAATAARVAASPVEPIVFTAAGGADVTGYDVDTGAVARTLPAVATQVDGIAVSPDGRYLYVFDGATGETSKRDAVSGALVREFPALVPSYVAPLGGLLGFRPGGHDVLVTPYGTVFDVDTGAELEDPGSPALGGAYALSATPDGRYVAGSHGFAEVRYTALGAVRLKSVVGGVGPYAPMTEQGCITADGSTYYRAAADCSNDGSGYAFCGTDVATRQDVPALPGKAYPAAIACPWNGLVIGGASAFYDAEDLYLYDQSGALVGMGNSSQRTSGRDLLADGIAVSADGARLVTLTRGSMGYDPSDEIRFQSLPAR